MEDKVYDLTLWLKEDDLESLSELEMIHLLSSLPYMDKEEMEKRSSQVLSSYSYFLKPYFGSLSLSPFEEKKDRESVSLSMIQSFVLFTIEKEKAISSLLLSIRYFLSLI